MNGHTLQSAINKNKCMNDDNDDNNNSRNDIDFTIIKDTMVNTSTEVKIYYLY